MNVLITGCNSGFGRELVTQFLQKGWTVIATLRHLEERKSSFESHMKQFPGQLMLIELDVTSDSQRQSLVGTLKEKFPSGIDCLINNAGLGYFGALTDFSQEQIRQQMEINFFSLAFLTREMIPFLLSRKGRIINISSVLGFSGMPFASLYNASKYAVEGLSEGLYFELKDKGVQVALVEPGGFRTNFSSNTCWAENHKDTSSLFYQESKNFKGLRQYLTSRPNPPSILIVVNKIVELATRKSIPLRTQVGKDSVAGYLMKKILPEKVYLCLYGKVLRKMMKKGEHLVKVGYATTPPL